MLNNNAGIVVKIAEKLLKSLFVSKLPFLESYKKRVAFTLAEVLITLLIIGVVASMVIPSIVSNTQDAEYKIAYKKAYAVISNVTKQALANSEFMPKQTTFETDTGEGNFNIFRSYFSVAKDCSNNNNGQCWDANGEMADVGGALLPRQSEFAFIDNSGMAWSLFTNDQNIILVDTNGFKSPNKYGKDRWYFTFADVSNNRIVTGLPSKVIAFPPDVISNPSGWSHYCHYPPCYFQSWLLQ